MENEFKETLWKVDEWVKFSSGVMDHIEDYVFSQYGDYPDPAVEGWVVKDLKSFLEKLVQRIGSGKRGMIEAKRDCHKIAHWACYLHKKLKEEEDG